MFSTAVTQKLNKPVELEGLEGKKIIGFTGSVEYRTDFQLVKRMIEAHKDKAFVFVGPVYAPEVEEMGISKMANVRFTGAKHISQLPAYLQHMDVMILPYTLSILTQSIYPLKLNEYLGAGKPVVSTSFSDDVRSFADVIYVAPDHDKFIQLLDTAIEENSQERVEKRMLRAKDNAWEARVRQFWAFIRDL